MLQHEDHFWRTFAAGGNGQNGSREHPRGMIALGDIGYVGYATDYPLLDLFGLVDPVVGKLPGRLHPEDRPRFHRLTSSRRRPRYVLIISAKPKTRARRLVSLPAASSHFDPRFRKTLQEGRLLWPSTTTSRGASSKTRTESSRPQRDHLQSAWHPR